MSQSQKTLLPIIALLGMWAPAFTQNNYQVDILGEQNRVKSIAYCINNSGQVVGWSEQSFTNGSRFNAWLWEDGVEKEIPSLGGFTTLAYGLNNSQQIVGEVDYGQGVLGNWTRGRFAIKSDLWLDTPSEQLPGIVSNFGRPSSINDHGVVVGLITSDDTNSVGLHEFHGGLWINGQLTELPTLGGEWSSAEDINNRGQIAMGAKDATGTIRAAVWENGVMTQLPDLGYGGCAKAINERSVIAGWVFNAAGESHAAMWDQHGVHDLGTLGGANAQARDINNLGVIVGQSNWLSSNSVDNHGFIYQNGQMHDLNSLQTGSHDFATFSYAKAINDAGQIIGWGEVSNGNRYGWRADPQTLRLTGLDAAVADGQQHTLRVEGAEANSTVIAYWGQYFDLTQIGGGDLFIKNPRPLRAAYTDALGHAYLGGIFLPTAAAGHSVVVQAINLPAGMNGRASNPLSFSFRP